MADSPPQPTSTELRELLVTILQVSKAVQAGLSRELESRLGLSLGEVDLLANLWAEPEGRLRMSQISDRLIVNRTAVTRLVDGLEARGLVLRRAARGDRRGVYAAITAAGRQAFAEAAPFIEAEMERQVGEFVTAEDVAAVRSGLEKILVGLGGGQIRCGDGEVGNVPHSSASVAMANDGP